MTQKRTRYCKYELRCLNPGPAWSGWVGYYSSLARAREALARWRQTWPGCSFAIVLLPAW